MRTLHQKVYLIRHGETEWTESKKHTGLTDIPLTEEGRSQVAWLTGALKDYPFKKIFVSPLKRTKETCAITKLYDHAQVLEELVEWDYGDYEGKTTNEIHKIDPKWSIFTSGAPGGESISDVVSRGKKVISKVGDISGDVAIFSSGHFLRALTALWLHLPISMGKHFLLSTASLSILGYEHGVPAIHLWNQSSSQAFP